MWTFGKIVLAIVLLIGNGVVWYMLAYPAYTYRYRMTVEVIADGALRRGASVVEMRTTDYKVGLPETKGVRHRVRGEAVFVDLGNGRNLIATLGFGPNGSEDRIGSLVHIAFLPSHPRLQVEDLATLTGTAPLTGNLIPTLVTFADLNDPKTARVVRPGEFEQVFGPDVHFRRAFIEMVPADAWPYTWFGWPRA
jgi:hypothetical protein